MKPGIVLASNQMKRPPVHPCENEGTVPGEGAVDISGGKTGGPGTDGQTEATLVLALDGQQAPDDGLRISSRRPGQQLGGQAISDHQSRLGASTLCGPGSPDDAAEMSLRRPTGMPGQIPPQ